MRKSPLLILLVAGLIITGIGLYATANPGPTPAPAGAHTVTKICDYLVDGGGAGSAVSATPGTPPPSTGQAATIQNVGAWNVCYGTVDLTITLASDSSYCLTSKANGTGYDWWFPCNGSQKQQWTRKSGAPSGGYRYFSKSDGSMMCAGGGVGSHVDQNTPNTCSSYHQSFRFEPQPIKTGRSALALAA